MREAYILWAVHHRYQKYLRSNLANASTWQGFPKINSISYSLSVSVSSWSQSWWIWRLSWEHWEWNISALQVATHQGQLTIAKSTYWHVIGKWGRKATQTCEAIRRQGYWQGYWQKHLKYKTNPMDHSCALGQRQIPNITRLHLNFQHCRPNLWNWTWKSLSNVCGCSWNPAHVCVRLNANENWSKWWWNSPSSVQITNTSHFKTFISLCCSQKWPVNVLQPKTMKNHVLTKNFINRLRVSSCKDHLPI